MRRVLVLLLALAFLPTLCLAGSINNFNTTDYQVNVTGTWVETNPLCVVNCTETISMSYEFESNLDAFNPTAATYGIFGWAVMNTIQVSASGFLGSFFDPYSSLPSSSLWADNGRPLSEGIPILDSEGDEVDLGNLGPGLSNTGAADFYIYNCQYQPAICHPAFPNYPTSNAYIFANTTTSTVVPVPAFDSAWELLLISAIACTFGLFVKHRLGLTPSR